MQPRCTFFDVYQMPQLALAGRVEKEGDVQEEVILSVMLALVDLALLDLLRHLRLSLLGSLFLRLLLPFLQ